MADYVESERRRKEEAQMIRALVQVTFSWVLAAIAFAVCAYALSGPATM